MSFDLIDSFKTDTITVKRAVKQGSFIDGRFVEAKPITFELRASVQPMTGKELKFEAQARQTSNVINLFVFEELTTGEQIELKQSDEFMWRGNDYQVFGVEDWTNTDLPHYKCKAEMVDTQGSKS